MCIQQRGAPQAQQNLPVGYEFAIMSMPRLCTTGKIEQRDVNAQQEHCKGMYAPCNDVRHPLWTLTLCQTAGQGCEPELAGPTEQLAGCVLTL